MPLIQFKKKATEGKYLVMTKGAVIWLPGGVLGVSEQLLQELETIFQNQGIRYRRLPALEREKGTNDHRRGA